MAVTAALGLLPQIAAAEPTPVDDVSAPAARTRPFELGAAFGVALPRGDLAPGPLVGVRAAIALDRSWAWAAFLNVDASRARDRGDVMLSPPAFPRSTGELDVRLDMLTIAAGGSVRVVAFGSMAVRLGVSAGVAMADAELGAYQLSRAERCVAPVGTLELMLVGSAGPLAWHGELAWREARCDLVDKMSSLDKLTSGALVSIGAAW